MAKAAFNKATKNRSLADLITSPDDMSDIISSQSNPAVTPERKKQIEKDFGDRIVQLDISKLADHRHHTYKVLDNEEMDTLVESIRDIGIIVPLIVRETSADAYEIIAGHRRKHAAQLVGLKSVPCIVVDVDDDASDIYMIDSNAQREKILPSEKAKSYKLKYEVFMRQGKRTDLLTDGETPSEDDDTFFEAIAANGEELSGRQIHRYMRLADLNDGLLDLVDADVIGATAGYILSFLSYANQVALLKAFREYGYKKMTGKQAENLRKAGRMHGSLSLEQIDELVTGKKRGRSENKKDKPKLTEKVMKDFYHERIKTSSPEKKIEYAKAAFMYFNEYLDAHPEELSRFEGEDE